MLMKILVRMKAEEPEDSPTMKEEENSRSSTSSINLAEMTYKCDICVQLGVEQKSYQHKSSLMRHKREEHPEGTYTSCAVCDERLGTKAPKDLCVGTSYNEHMKHHIESRIYICELCGWRFEHKRTKQNHKQKICLAKK